MTRRALVLAGGGVTGIGWELGVLLGLRDAGVDPTGWNRVVGTSAGSVVGAALGTPDGLDLLRAALGDMGAQELRDHVATLEPGVMAVIGDLWFGPAAALDGPDRAARVEIGRLGSTADPTLEGRFIGSIERLLPSTRWPPALLVTAVDVSDGSPSTFDAGSAVPLATAVAASCSVPGMFPPVSIGAHRYMDGGVASASNAELASGHELVVIVAPNRPDGPWAGRLAREMAELRAEGSRVVPVLVDDASLATFGTDTMDTSRAAAALQAGVRVGRNAARRIESGTTSAGSRAGA